MKSGIYSITNTVNGKIYIGLANNVVARKSGHYYALRRNIHKNIHLQTAWNKYGEESFKFEKIETCEKDFLIEREDYWAKLLKVHDREYGYNLNETGIDNLNKQSTESIQKRVATRKINGVVLSEEGRKKIGEAAKGNTYNKGRKASEETKKKLSESHKGKKPNEEVIKKFTDRMKGNKYGAVKRSEEFKRKISEYNKGKKHTLESIQKMKESYAERNKK